MRKTTLLITSMLTIATMVSAQNWTDVTGLLNNPNFDGSINGWTDDFGGASQNHGYQGASYNNGNIQINQFAEAWRPSDWWTTRNLGDGSISQELNDLPTGRYRLEVDGIAVNQANSYNTVTGVLLFISNGVNEATTEMTTDNERPEHFVVEMNSTKTNLTIGVRTESATANWIAFDNVKLYWSGNEVKASTITFENRTADMAIGEELQLKASITPANTTFKKLEYSSSNESVATVNQDGIVTSKKAGITTITAKMAIGNSTATGTCIITVKESEVSSGDLIVNEVQQANIDMFIDPSFNYGGWIELYNTTDASISLAGLYISDDAKDLRKMPLDNRFGIVPPKGFHNIWFDHYSRWSPSTTNFKLDCDGGTVYLSKGDGTVIIQQSYPPAIARTSYARTTDGGSTWEYTDQPTPAQSNNGSVFAATRLAAPEIDAAGGFFTKAFTAQVTIPTGTTLRYTTDGSTPTLSNGATSNNGRFDISKTTILRLRLFKDGELSSPVVTRSFIYKDKDYTLPVISLVSDDANLYGDDYGIFVRGNGNGRPGNGQNSACNWNMEWDRPANIEYFTESGNAVFNQEVGIEASGGWSRAWAPHSFNIKANKVYEGVNRMNFQFFENKPYLQHKALKVRNGGNNYNGGRILDAAIQQVVATSGLYAETQSYKPVHIFHNGQYIGVENLREPNNKNYAFANHGIDTDDQDQWKMSPDSGYVQQVGTKESWDHLLSLATNASDALAYEQIKGLLDIEEYCNYMAIELYIAGTDWPKNNIKGFRERSEGQSNSRFRFVLFDTDGAFATSNAFTWFESTNWWKFDALYGVSDLYPEGRIYTEIEFVTLFLNLLDNAEFKKQFVDQFCIVAGSVFEPTRASQVITDMLDHVNPALALENTSATSTANTVRNQLSSSRQANSVNNMRDYLGLGSGMNITLSADIDEARLQINGYDVPTGKFAGRLFDPISVNAAAPAGYRFLGWKSNKSSNTVTLFSKNSEWNYYDQGSLDNTNWKSNDYDEQWESGKAPLGYFTSDYNNDRGYQTFLDYGGNANNKYPTYYFRKHVTLSAKPKSSESFSLDWVADDGFVIYVNGQEAGRYLMNNTANPTFNSFADTYANANPESGTMTLDASLFNSGTNIIAVEVHNNNANSTDIYWDASLQYNKESASNIVSTEPTYQIPSGTTSVILTASYEKMNESDDEAWDAHPVKINEVSASNDIYASDLFKKSDWIELYNTTDEDIDLEGMFLSDHLDDPEKSIITADGTDASTIIPAHGHIVIWADKTEGLNQLHADFKLNNEDGSLIVLTAADKSWADTLVYCKHDGFHTVGLYPDGGSKLYVMEQPTIGKTNVLTTTAIAYTEPVIEKPEEPLPDSIDDLDGISLAFDGTALTLKGTAYARLDIYTPSGQLVMTTRMNEGVPVNLTSLLHGVYVATAKNDDDLSTMKISLK